MAETGKRKRRRGVDRMNARGLGEALWGMGIPVQELVMGMFASGFGFFGFTYNPEYGNGQGHINVNMPLEWAWAG